MTPPRPGKAPIQFNVASEIKDEFDAWIASGAGGSATGHLSMAMAMLPRLGPARWKEIERLSIERGQRIDAFLAQAIEAGLATLEAPAPAPVQLTSLPPAPRGLPVATTEQLVEAMKSLQSGQQKLAGTVGEIVKRLDRAGIDGKGEKPTPKKRAGGKR